MGYGKMEISSDLVLQLLNLPQGTQFVGAEPGIPGRTFFVTITHSDLPEVPAGAAATLICPVFSKRPDGIVMDDWGIR